jgi:MYXO-CTERM domain-containing protein
MAALTIPTRCRVSILARLGFAAAVASCVASGACTSGPQPAQDEEVARIGQNILDGKPDSVHTFVMGITNAAASSWCSGSLIAPNLVLTAQHCVAPCPESINCNHAEFGDPWTGPSIFVTFESDMYTAPKYSFRKGAEVYVPPGARSVCGYDVALVRLEENVPNYIATPINPRVDIQVEDEEVYMAIGYGNVNASGSGAGARRYREDLKVMCVGGVSCPFDYEGADREWVGEIGTCPGDSGGPAMDAAGRVIGVVSRGPEGCKTPTYGSVFGWANWIKEIAAEAAVAGKYVPKPWVTGGSSDPDAGLTVDAGGDKKMGAPCETSDQCADGVCVTENDQNVYCTAPCAQPADCPSGWFCDPARGGCVQKGGFGAACVNGHDCRSTVCAATDAASYCSQACGADAGVCPNHGSCSADGQCQLPAAPSAGDVQVESKGCSTGTSSPRSGSAWLLALGLAALLRRRTAS